jgi:hypothetical protein
MSSENDSVSPVVSVVTVNYKVADLVTKLVASVPQAAAGLPVEIVVVDNASADGSVDELRRECPHVQVIASEVNLGFGRGNNLGVEHARGRFLALVNPDVVLPAGSLAALVEFLQQRPHVGLVGPRVELPDGSTQSSAKQLPGPWDVVRVLPGIGRAEQIVSRVMNGKQVQHAVPCGVVHGSCMVFRAEAFRSAGGMPSNIFMYGEEPIMGHRIKQAGFEVWYNPAIHVLHQDEACADKRWVPHQKALRKRNGHISAHSEIWPRPLSMTWNALMAVRELSRAAGDLLSDRESTKRHLDFVRLHLSGMTRVKGDAANSLPD